MEEIFSFKEGLNLDINKLSRITISRLEQEWTKEMMEESLEENAC